MQVEGQLGEVMALAGQHAITNITSHDGDLEDAFLAYYSGDEGPDA